MNYSPLNFPDTFSQLVAESTASLPPLIKAEHEDMLLIATEDVMSMFWDQYIDLLPAEGKQSFLKAIGDETGQALVDWNYAYANFPEDAQAEARGEKVLAYLAIEVPKILKLMYDDVEAATDTTLA